MMISKGEEINFIKNAGILIREIQNSMHKLCSDFRVETPQGSPFTSITSVWNLSTLFTQLPSVEISADQRLVESFKGLLPAKGFKSVYRSIVQDLTQIGSLGRYHDIISSKVKLDKEATFFSTGTEEEKYFKYKSSWKIPM